MMKLSFFSVSALLLLSFTACKNAPSKEGKTADDKDDKKFAEHVRTTNFQTPEQERAGFKLPPGFEITLYASEPDISKPINMQFDAAGRLWVSQSSEYPMAAAPGSGKDRITILDDTNHDGKADKFTDFAADLNIPIGLLPVKGGAIGYSIPNLYKFIDKDGDGVYEDKKILFGPFGHQDTHGMVSNLIRGFDGWIYACHGFTNTSTIAGTDGDSITMISGNTFRFKEDGSHVEQTSYGRVNPFGYAFDDYGYLYSVDCHSKPIYQMIDGAEYPHFGKKQPAIGFAPEMMSYELGSTAISGLVYYIGNSFPKEYQGSFYNGDVVTCRINRNTVTHKGSTPISKREEDFLISSDPWFRPVNIKMGPDGSMYVADFYNKVIGHYEVPLNHPGRDHHSGRIWKITYVGDKKQPAKPVVDWAKASLKELVTNLNQEQLTTRMLIADEIVDRFGSSAAGPLMETMKVPQADNKAFIQSMWILFRIGALPDEILNRAAENEDPMLQVHALRIMREKKSLSPAQWSLAFKSLKSTNANVQRSGAEVLSRFPQTENLKALISMYQATSDADNHLKYTLLEGIRQNMRNKKVMHDVTLAQWPADQLTVLMKVIPDVPLPEAASYALDYVQRNQMPDEQLVSTMEYVGRYVPVSRLDQAIDFIRKQFPGKEDMQFQFYQIVRKGLAQQGAPVTAKMKAWGVYLAKGYLQGDYLNDATTWRNVIIVKGWQPENPWNVVNKPVVENTPSINMIWSEFDYDPNGKLLSPVFKLPAKLSMKVYNSDVFKSEKKSGESSNVVRIRLKGSQQVVAEYRPSSKHEMNAKDQLQNASFDLAKYAGQQGFIEVLDSSRNGGIGIGAFEPAVLPIPEKGPGQVGIRQLRAAEIIGDFKVKELEPYMLKLLNTSWADQKARASAAAALANIDPMRNGAVIATVFNNPATSPELRSQLAIALSQSPLPEVYSYLRKGFNGASRELQTTIAGLLVNSNKGIDNLLEAAKAKEIPADLLDEISVKEKLENNSSARQKEQLALLMKGSTSNDDRKKIIEERIANYAPNTVTVEDGHKTFTQNCSMCHQIAGVGGMIGPQLNGIGNWGIKSLTNKILNPNSSISEAFRMYNITLKNGKAISGLYRREEGQVLIFANPGGQEFSVAKNDIKEKVASKYTLMPDHFRNTLSKTDYDGLLKFLLSQKE